MGSSTVSAIRPLQWKAWRAPDVHLTRSRRRRSPAGPEDVTDLLGWEHESAFYPDRGVHLFKTFDAPLSGIGSKVSGHLRGWEDRLRAVCHRQLSESSLLDLPVSPGDRAISRNHHGHYTCVQDEQDSGITDLRSIMPVRLITVSYTHLTLPTKRIV